MQLNYSNLPWFQIYRQGFAKRVQCRLGCAITVTTARIVIGNRAHTAGDIGDFAALPHKRDQGFSYTQRCVGVDFHLCANGTEIDAAQLFILQQARIVDQQTDVFAHEACLQLFDAFVSGYIYASNYLCRHTCQLIRGLSTHSHYVMPFTGIIASELKPNATISTCDDNYVGFRHKNSSILIRFIDLQSLACLLARSSVSAMVTP